MSISVKETGPSWTAFKTAEKAKFPHFEKDWFDDNGQVYGNGNLRAWKWEADQYVRDRAQFLSSLASSQIDRPPPLSSAIPILKQSVPRKSLVSANNNPGGSNTAFAKNTRQPDNSQANMPRRTKRSQAWKGRKRRGPKNKALNSVKVPFKMVIEVDSKKSSAETGHWHNHLTIKELAGPAIKNYEEFKCCSVRVRYIPEDITTGSGLYAACLLDQNGFGDPSAATTTWFPRVADLPGARLCHVTRGCAFSWRPTEPDSRNYRKVLNEADYVVCSFYIFGNSTSLSIKGQLLITGLLRARGEYYAANIATRIRELSLFNEDDASSFGDVVEEVLKC